MPRPTTSKTSKTLQGVKDNAKAKAPKPTGTPKASLFLSISLQSKKNPSKVFKMAKDLPIFAEEYGLPSKFIHASILRAYEANSSLDMMSLKYSADIQDASVTTDRTIDVGDVIKGGGKLIQKRKANKRQSYTPDYFLNIYLNRTKDSVLKLGSLKLFKKYNCAGTDILLAVMAHVVDKELDFVLSDYFNVLVTSVNAVESEVTIKSDEDYLFGKE